MEPLNGTEPTSDEFDDLLRRAAPTPSAAADATAVQLARETRAEAAGAVPIGRARRSRRRTLLGAAVAAMALTGAGTVAAHQLSIPPFQTLEEGVERARTGIPVTYTNSLDRKVECLAFIEYRNLDDAQATAIEDASRSDEWDGYGQRVLDELDLADASPETQNDAISEVVSQDLWRAARRAVPEMVHMRDSDGPVFAGTSMSCANPGGVDGRP